MSVPKLRFKADNGSSFSDWEKRKIGNFIKESNILGHTGKEARKLTVKLWGKGVICKETIFSGSENTQYYVRHAGQLIYGKLDFLNCAFGIIPPELDGYESTLDSPAFDIHDISAEFLLYYIIRKEFYKKNGDKANGSRKAKRIHPDVFLEMPIMVPSIPEQQKITDLLSIIISVIEKQQATIDAWEQRKKGVMQEIFSQKVRFKADDGSDFPDWKEKTLGNIFVERTERSVGGEELLSVTIAQGVIRQSDSDKRNNSSENKSNYKVVKKNDLAYNTMRMWQGAEGVSDYDGIVSPAYTIVTPKTGNNVKYFEMLFKQLPMLHLFQRYSQGLTSDTWNLKFTAFAKIKCDVPCEKEQDKIVNCISLLDDVIKKQKEILEKWQELKKGLLQQMFV